jgi:hypothetical protein
MPPALTPIIELRAWYEGHALKHKNLARSLNLSPQQLSELFSGRNQPTGTQVLAILEFLRTNNMTTVDEPKTLTAAKDRIAELTAELNELKAGKATSPTGTVHIPPAVAVTQPIAPKPAAAQPNAPAPPATTMTAWETELARVEKARAAGLSTKPLSEQSLAELRTALANEPSSEKRNEIYKMVKAAERDLLGPKRISRLRGA